MRVKELFTTAAAIVAFATAAHAQTRTVVDVIDAGPVGVWMNHLEYRPFEKAEVAFSAPAGSHVLVLRIGDDGYNVRGLTTVEILYPRPLRSAPLSAAEADALKATFRMRGGPGTGGYVFAFASAKPFDLSHAQESFRWIWTGERFSSRDRVEDIAASLVERFAVKAGDLLGASEDEYVVVDKYGSTAAVNQRSLYQLSSEFHRRCAMGGKESGCESVTGH